MVKIGFHFEISNRGFWTLLSEILSELHQIFTILIPNFYPDGRAVQF